MKRFVLPSADLASSGTTVTGDLYHHMVNVLRLREGAEIIVADGNGAERRALIHSARSGAVDVRFTGEKIETAPTGPAVTVYQGLPKGDKMELIIQKCAELGAAAVVPFCAERSVRRIKAERSPELTRRWQRVAEEAARQSGNRVPRVRMGENLRDALKAADDQIRLLLWEEEEVRSLREEMARVEMPERVSFIVGPEGGITAAEAEVARLHGFVPVTLGRSILRTETAGLVVLSLLQFQWGCLGGRRP